MTHDSMLTGVSLPTRPPKVLIGLALLLGLIALVVSPSLLIALGPLRASLVSENELTKHTAELTILGFRALCLFMALILAIVLARWQSFIATPGMKTLAAHPVPRSEREYLSTIKNRSLLGSGVLAVVSVTYLAVSPTLIPSEVQRWIASESGIVERGTALLFLMSSVLAFLVVNRLRITMGDGRDIRRIVWLTLLGLFFFLCFGEELSWGQRILDIETLDAMKGINVQDENNLHNMMGYLADHLFILGVFVYGSFLPLLCTKYDFIRRSCHWIGLPIASVGLAIGFALASGIHEWTIYRFLPETELRAAEVRELLAGFCFFLLMLESWTLSRLQGDS